MDVVRSTTQYKEQYSKSGFPTVPYENRWCTTNLPLCSATHLHSLPTYIDSYPEAIRVLVVAYVHILYDMDIEAGAMGMVYTILESAVLHFKTSNIQSLLLTTRLESTSSLYHLDLFFSNNV